MDARPTISLPIIPVHFRFCDGELTAVFPSLPGSDATVSVKGFVFADGFVSLDLAYAASGVAADPAAYHRMHAYLTKRLEDDAMLVIVGTIE